MAYTTTTKTSYGQRLSGSLKGIVTGFVLFIVATIALFWNEGNFVKGKRAIGDAQKNVTIVKDVSTIDNGLDGKLIHASAMANTGDTLTDNLFGISISAIAIEKEVEYFQYVEQASSQSKDKIGGGQETVTTYTYRKEWVSQPVNSNKFEDPAYQLSNSVLANIESTKQTADNVSFGAYRLPSFMIHSISGSVNLDFVLSDEKIQEWQKLLGERTKLAQNDSAVRMIHQSGNVIYLGKSPATPEIGDLRITFTKIVPKEISIIGKVQNNTFEQYVSKNGKTFSKVNTGNVSADLMFNEAHSSNSTRAWIIRIIGILFVVWGLRSMFSILPTLFKVLPFLSNIVSAGIGLVCTVGGFAWSLIIISIAWLFYRPLIGIPMLLAAIAGIWYLKKRAKEKKAMNNE